MSSLRLGPLLRYVGETVATVWVETAEACEVEILGHRERTFEIAGHHYALVCVKGLEPGRNIPYEVALDGERVWPQHEPRFPTPMIRTYDASRERLRVGFASCRTSAPHEPPYTLGPDDHPDGKGVDSLRTLALSMSQEPAERWPDAFLLLGDQVYADDVSPGTLEFIHARADHPAEAPPDEVADYEEYTRLYWDSWRDPAVGWLMSVVPTAMIFDDHDVNDDWNTSRAWVEKMREKPWWRDRIRGGLMSYWVYQHLGNLSPGELDEDEIYERVRAAEGDAAPILREFADRADHDTDGTRWSFHRDWGHTRLVMMDSRGGRMLGERREMVDDAEWDWIAERATGDVNHLLLGTSLPVLLAPGMHDLEMWNEAVCDGAWGRLWSRIGESIRQGLDLEHWAAFGSSFARLVEHLRSVAAGERGSPPASIVMLSGDVHHAYLAEMGFRPGAGVRSPVWQAVCSPMRNPLARGERAGIKVAMSRGAALLGRLLRRSAGVADPEARWRFVDEPTFDNQVATIEIDGRSALLRLEKAAPDQARAPRLETVLEHPLTRERGPVRAEGGRRASQAERASRAPGSPLCGAGVGMRVTVTARMRARTGG